MRKLLSVLSSTLHGGVRRGLLFFALLATTTLWAHDFKVDGIYYNYLYGNNVAVTYHGEDYYGYHYIYAGEVIIPETVTYNGTTYSVTSIGESAFDGCYSLTSVTIPNSVTSIGDKAFYYCESLTSITIPNSITSIGDYAFYYCESLTSITIPNSVTSIEDYAFFKCSSLTSVTIGNSVTSIGDAAFGACSSLTSITIPNSVTSIGNNAFDYCSSLTSITIPNSVTSIGERAFQSCYSLTSPVYNAHCFAYMPPSFEGAYTIPDGIKQIAGGAFHSCSSLTSITIPNSVTSIGERACEDCSSLTSVTINSDAIVRKAYSDNSNISHIFGSQVTEYIIGESVTSIGGAAFYDCYSLTSVTIGNSVTSIGDYAFFNCSSLTSITIPNSVTTIGDEAFSYCRSLTSITIPNSVTSIRWGAFYGCSSLTSITCEATIPPTIESFTFDGVSKSIPVYVPCGQVDAYKAASGWSNFTNIQEPLAEYSIQVYTSNSQMGSAKVNYNNCIGTQITATANYGCHFAQWSDGNTDNPRVLELTQDTVLTAEFAQTFSGRCGDKLYWAYDTDTKALTITGSGDMWNYYFYESNTPWEQVASDITSVFLPDGLTSIGVEAFAGCKSLTSITIPNSVTRIGSGAFRGCSSLTSITIPNSVTYIEGGSFAGCSSLTSITIPNSVTHIGDGAEYGGPFSNCSSLTSITIPNSVTYIGYQTFSYCSSLRSITIPNSVTYIENEIFYGCSSLNSITCEATTPPTIESFTFDGVSTSICVYVPCGSESAYKAADGWKELTNIQEPQAEYSIQVYTSNSQMGSAKVNYNNCTGNQISATPNFGYYFVQWSDGNTENPRTLELTQDTTLTAEFAQSFSGQCGDNLYWSYDETTKTISITDSGKMYDYTAKTQPWLLFKEQIVELTTTNSVTSIGTSAFEGCTRLGKISLGTGLEEIAANAFAGCNRLHHIYCYPTYPPFADQSSFANYNVYLHVPCDYQEEYDLDMVWGNFKYIECMGAESEPSAPDTVIVIPGTNDVTITWPTEDNADTYTIVIKKGDEVFCTLTFNADGQLLNIAFAPSRDGNNRPALYAEQVVNGGLRFTVTGLEAGTNYSYDVITTDQQNQEISTHSGEFTTKSNVTTNMDNIQSPVTTCQKLLRNGQLLIIRDGKTYSVMGQEIE